MLLDLFSSPLALLAFLLAIIIGLTVHEFAHAWMATRLGDFTAKYAGRLSLNPARHFDPTGTLFLLFVGFGWGKPVPVNPNALKNRYDELKVSIAGPTANFLLALILSIPLLIADQYGFDAYNTYPLTIIGIIVQVNLLLAAFNILPIYPLDGSKILSAIAPESMRDAVDRLEKSGPILLLTIIFVEYFLRIPILVPLITWIERILSFVISTLLYPLDIALKYLSSLL
ncbi:site-2 protease family protein [Candidatus Microgenomates bacterium]|nr:site-2 protease family protein [Candidatus Microgenomates bacterium]